MRSQADWRVGRPFRVLGKKEKPTVDFGFPTRIPALTLGVIIEFAVHYSLEKTGYVDFFHVH
jgi:hypothetical protein